MMWLGSSNIYYRLRQEAVPFKGERLLVGNVAEKILAG